MDNGADSMLDVFLFETDDLLEHLDDILLACENNKAFDQESINEIFRIMHTIKGSSAMMQFNSLTVITHKMEDLFSFVREKGVEKEFIEPLIDLMFRAGDFLKNETEKVRAGQPLTTDIGGLERNCRFSSENLRSRPSGSGGSGCPCCSRFGFCRSCRRRSRW